MADKSAEQSGDEEEDSLSEGKSLHTTAPSSAKDGESISGGEETDVSVHESVAGRSSPTKRSVAKSDEANAQEDDFGQAEVLEAKKAEEAVRRQEASWGSEFDETEGEEEEEDDEGESKDAPRKAAERSKGKDTGRSTKSKRRRKVVTKKSGGPSEKQKVVRDEEDDFVEPEYFLEDYVSGPIVTPDYEVYPHVVHVFHSYGYDCERPYNLHMLDSNNALYITGNYLHFYRLFDGVVIDVRRSASGYGYGHVAIHPSKKYFAVGEKGNWPMIVVYSWSSILKVFRVLRKGTERGYSYVDFTPKGDLLCSQGMEPDYLLTIWNWEKERIVLHVKAFSQDIYRATFSLTHPGQLTTSGLGHIRFWKMAETFTGLKLQGLIGRFGKTEISDIQGYAGLPDGKVVSGSEWGNLLVWDGGLIVVEIIQKMGKNCHDGEITNVLLLETGELLTIGLDGYIRTWESEVIDLADTVVDDSGKFEVEPIFEMKISTTAQPVSVVKNIGEEEGSWFVQDAYGKIWSINIGAAMKDTEYEPGVLFSCPGGAITSVAASSKYTMVAVGTSTGQLWVFNYLTKQQLAKHKYNHAITKLIWLPEEFDPLGITFVASFADGNVRLVAVQRALRYEINETHPPSQDELTPFQFCLLQILRFHKARINVMYLDDVGGILYTCGEDRVIFASNLELTDEIYPILKPLGFVTAPFPVCCMDLHPVKDYRLIIASRAGRVAECRKPIWGEVEHENTFNQGKLHGRRWYYSSVKSHIRREERRKRRKVELEEKLVELKADVAERRAKGLFVEEEVEVNRLTDHYKREQLADDEEELYIPEKPCPIYGIYYQINKAIVDQGAQNRNFFLHVSAYDAGYIYECKCSRPEPGGFHAVPPTPPFEKDVAIRCYTFSEDNDYLVFGMEDGSLRVMPRYVPPEPGSEQAEKKEKPAPLAPSALDDAAEENNSDDIIAADEEMKRRKKKVLPPFPVSVFPYDLSKFVCVPMHDPDRGAINDFAWSYDYKLLFSVAEDGSIFSYRWDPTGEREHEDLTSSLGTTKLPADTVQIPDEFIKEDTQDPNALTLEELKMKAEKDRLWDIAEGKKEVLRKKIRELKSKFRFLLQKNNEIPDEAKIPRSHFEMDPAIRKQKKERLMKGIEEVYRRYEWQSAKTILQIEKIEKYFFSEIDTFHIVLKDISHTSQVHTFRQRILTSEFELVLQQNQEHLVREEIQLQAEMNVAPIDYTIKPAHVTRVFAKELIGEYDTKKYDTKTMHQIRYLEERLQKRYEKELRWAELNAQRIPDDYEDPVDIVAIVEAKENLGNYKLKSSGEYTGEKISAATRRQRVIDMKLRIYEQIKTFNKYVLDLREEKRQILKECRALEEELKKIQKQLPPDLQKPIPPIYEMEPIEEPEREFDITKDMIFNRVGKKIEELGLNERWQQQNQMVKDDPIRLENGRVVTQPKVQAKKKKKQELGPKVYVHKGDKKEAQSTVKARKAFFKPKTPLANVRLELALQFRCFQQDISLRKLRNLIDYFRERVEKVRDERVALQVDILLMAMKLLNLIQELDIVKDFDSTEKAVLERFYAQKVETSEAKERMDRANRRLTRVKGDLLKMEQAISDVQKEVAVVIGEKQKFSDYLWKVYKKKIRVENAGDVPTEGSGMSVKPVQSSSSSTGDSSDSTSQDSGSDLFKMPKQKLNPNVCPETLDRAMYEKVCEFRAKRTQLEIEAEAQKKVVEKVERDFREVERIHEKYTGRLEGIGEEVLILQRKRQAKMNELPALVVLKADQIQCLDEDEFDEYSGSIVSRMKHHFPPLNEVVLFPKDGIAKLDLRIEELKEETQQERNKHKRARHMMVRLREELAKLEDEVGSINQRCKREMLAKFGKMVDLDDVCAAIINLEILDELMRLEVRRNWHYRERKKIADEIEKARDRLTFLTKENSENNTLLAILIERQRDVEYFLFKQTEKHRTSPVDDDIGDSSSFFRYDEDLISNEDALEELFNLEDILIRQESRILILREAIAACKFKSGLPPLIPLRTIKDDVATSFMTMNELYALRERRNLELETVFLSKDADTIGDSHSNFPSFATPVDSSAAWGEPQLHTPFDANNTVEGPPPGAPGQAAEKDVEEDFEDETEDEEEELFDVTYKPEDDEEEEETEEGAEKDTPSYPLNVIPDDQMPGGEEEDTVEEEYEEDPLPVRQPSPNEQVEETEEIEVDE